MLLRISIIVAILAGLAVGGLNFVKVKEKITTLVQDRDEQKSAKETAMKERDDTKRKLASTEKTLQQTQTELASTKDELSAATKRVQTVTA